MQDTTARFLADHREHRTEVLADRLVEVIQGQNPGYGSVGVVTRPDLWLSCLDNIRRVLELLAAAVHPASATASLAPIGRDPAYEAARATGRRRAEQGQPLDDVLRSFRMGGRLIWEDLVEQGRSLDGEDVRAVGTALWEVVDQTSAQVAVAYHEHERISLRAVEQLRAELWEGLLGGRAQDPGFALQAARTLDLAVDALLVVVSATGVDAGDVVHRLGPHASAWVRRSRDTVGLVALRDEDPRVVHDLLQAWAADAPGSAVAVSSAVQGVAEVGAGHRQASLARTSLGRAGFAAFDECLPEVLLLSSPEISARLTRAWVTPLTQLPPAEGAALLDTLEAWVECGGSATRTAELVPCHRNTVLNRLRRVGDLTGRTLVDATPPVELVLALRARRLEQISAPGRTRSPAGG